jgi:flagellar operon protein
MSIIKGGIPENLRIRPGLEESPRLKKEEAPKSGAVPFSELLEGQLRQAPKTDAGEGLKFSAHAQARLQSRGIELSPDEMIQLQEAVQRAKDKGSRESLILTDKAAFIVSVKNQTVITAVDRESMKENVFTNIDSTVMI